MVYVPGGTVHIGAPAGSVVKDVKVAPFFIDRTEVTVLRLRVERARTLLQQGMDPLSAALATGFCDQSHLARHMQRTLGITPGAPARAFRAAGGRTWR
jgi:AraC-like DNA-binding protein